MLRKTFYRCVNCNQENKHLHWFDFPVYGDDYIVLFLEKGLVCRSCLARGPSRWFIPSSFHISELGRVLSCEVDNA